MRVMRHSLALTVVVGALLVSGAAEASVADARAAFEARARSQLTAKAPAVVPRWDEANAARDAGRLDDAAAAYRDVIAADPEFDHAHRKLCSVLARQEHWDEAERECRAALTLDPNSAINHAAVARVLVGRPNPGRSRLAEAEREVHAASWRDSDDYDVLAVGAEVSLANGDDLALLRDVSRMKGLGPDEPETLTMSIYLDAARGDTDAARQGLAKSRSRLPPETVASLEAAIERGEDRPTLGHLARKFGKIFLGWALAFLGLFVFGSTLSRMTLKSAERVDPAARGEARGSTRWLRRAYAILIALAGVFFYVSLPLVAIVVVVLAGGLIYGVLETGWIATKLILLVIVMALASLIAIVRSLLAIFQRSSTEDPGLVLPRDEHPELHRVLDGVAKVIATRGPDKVFLTPGTSMAVFERGSALRTMTGRGERCLIVGAGLLPGFRVGPFKAILAHELGHFKNEDTAGGATSLVVRRSLTQMIVSLSLGGVARRFNPAWLFVEGFHHVFLRISQGASRLQEVLADRWAITAYGSENFVAGLQHVIRREVCFDVEVDHAIRVAVESATPLPSLYRRKGQIHDRDDVKEAVREAIQRAAGPYDSHPSPAARIDHANALAVANEPTSEDAGEVWSLLADRSALVRKLMAQVQRDLQHRSGVFVDLAPDDEMTPEEFDPRLH